jgi:CheY-like chemotaxis protein
MPKMNGLELFRKIRKVDDKIKVCFITAFDVSRGELKKESLSSSNTTDQDKGEELDIKCIIQKPIDIYNLVKPIKEELTRDANNK